VFDVVKPWLDQKGYTPERIRQLDSALANYLLSAQGLPLSDSSSGPITVRVAAELVGHEAIVQEAYKDSVGVWTWSVGIAATSGYNVLQYKDNPQPLLVCLRAYVDLLREKYLPAVLKVFDGVTLSESQLAAALSFHYNTGAILRASWPKLWLAGKVEAAADSFMEWKNPPAIIPRRQKECDLFFEGVWSGDGKATVYKVRKPSYTPDWGSAVRVDITKELTELLAAA
jgi:lysozyme